MSEDNKPQNEIIAANPTKTPEKPRIRKKKPRIGLYIKTVSWHKLHKKMMTILGREIDYLMVANAREELTDKQSLKLVNYLKLEDKLLKFEDELEDNITDEELHRIASKTIKPKL